MKTKKLYFITDSSGLEEKDFLDIVRSACKGKPDLIQLREKNKTSREILDLAIKVKEITDEYDIPLIIDDRIDIAAIVGCGVHLGADDVPIKEARKFLGENVIVGATAKTLERAKEAESEGADYLGVGAIYPTTTKVKTKITSVETLNEICRNVNIPVYAIGGLNKDNVDILKGSEIDGVCVVSAIMKAEDPYKETLELKEIINML